MNHHSDRRRRLFAFLLLSPIVLLALFIVFRRTNPPPPAAPRPGWKPAVEVNPEYRKALSEWSSATYTALEGDLQDTVKSIKIVNEDLELTRDQEDQLRESLSNLLLAFHRGDFEAYLRFRAPTSDYKYNASTVKWLKQEIEKRYRKNSEQLPSEPEQILRLYWDRCYGGSAFSNYWRGISLERSQVLIERGQSLPPKLTVFALHVANAGVANIAPSLAFESTPDKILKRENELVYATVSLLIRTKPPEPPHPFYCRLYWEKDVSKWLPMELVSSYTGPRDVEVVF